MMNELCMIKDNKYSILDNFKFVFPNIFETYSEEIIWAFYNKQSTASFDREIFYREKYNLAKFIIKSNNEITEKPLFVYDDYCRVHLIKPFKIICTQHKIIQDISKVSSKSIVCAVFEAIVNGVITVTISPRNNFKVGAAYDNNVMIDDVIKNIGIVLDYCERYT